ncbi:MAG: RsmE family RNA methyltransferase [Acidimicrobiales bacterium]
MRPPGPPDGAAPHLFVTDLGAPEPDEHDRHHLEKALRVRPGDAVTVSDGAGRWCHCTWRSGVLDVGSEAFEVAAPTPPLGVGFALTKGTKPDLVVQKLTEIGMSTIVPIVSERVVVRWDETKVARNLERLRRVAREAAMQSRRVWLPTVAALTRLDAVPDSAVVADRSGMPIERAHTMVLVGPEGGWTDTERRSRAAVCLGDHVLRAETAAIVAATRLSAAHGR